MQTKEENKFNHSTRLFNKVMAIPKKKMSQAEKIMFSYIISYCLDKGVFDADNDYIARVLGDKPQSVTDYISRLKEMGVLNVECKRMKTKDGNYHGTKRYITVINLEGWTEKMPSTPEVPLIPKKNSKKKDAIETVETILSTENSDNQNDIITITKIDKVIEPLIDTLLIAVAQPLIKPKKVKKDQSLVEMLKEVELKEVKATASSEKKSNSSGDIVILDSNEGIEHSTTIGEAILDRIKNKQKVSFVNVSVKFDDELFSDEATLIENGSNKYYLKSSLKRMNASVFEQ